MDSGTRKRSTGMILGKFLPPHRGHEYLVEFGRHYVDDLTVLVCSIEAEPIPGELRHRWMRRMFPDCNVVWVNDENPQEPADHPDFWDIWVQTIRRVMPEGPDYVFASEPYGFELAARLGASFVPVDIQREMVPVSGTAIRQSPMLHWDAIPDVVRPYFVKRVCIFGPESTGKTTLARDLAAHFNTCWVHEYARPLLDHQNGECFEDDIPRIVRGQVAAEDALAGRANRVLFTDTDVLTTTVWSDVLFGRCPPWIRALASTRKPDLTLLLDIDVPWVDDAQRHLPHLRREFWQRCVDALESEGRPWVAIQGDWTTRFATAVQAVERLIDSSGS
ncbi:MAG: AAA family ATPase [bacterium]